MIREIYNNRERVYMELRDEVLNFAEAMEAKLKRNDHKTHWRKLPIEALRRLMMLELEEFNVAREFFGAEEAMNELVDIANFAMMLRDRLKHVEPLRDDTFDDHPLEM